ncbi:MAG: M20/M25/M40 family metallo-hydrolase [Halanaerobiales bacterium]|nr:M20/M25/M40 family metallo-hydrolase [Halanaerobiales bacterium]
MDKLQEVYRLLLADPVITKGLAFIKGDQDKTLADQVALCEIPAPPFQEQKRAADFMERLQALGLKDIHLDQVGNVLGIRPGTGNGPKLVVAAHLDTVFPAGTDTSVKKRGGKLYAPGIADDTRALAEILTIVRAFEHTGLATIGDLIFCGDVGEEGLGNLRGVKQLFTDHRDIDGFISIDGTGVSSITYQATGSYRYRISYHGPGGHSFAAFGRPSAIHALGRAIAQIADIEPPEQPKTTFTVGVVEGGTAVNAIAAKASMLVDLRSNGEEELKRLEKVLTDIVQGAALAENKRWGSQELQVQLERIGERPAGSQELKSPLVQVARASLKALGLKAKLTEAGSTDANVPISLGIPALAVGRGGKSGDSHSLNEWFDPTDAFLGPQKVFLMILGLVGVKGLTKPLLPIHPADKYS